MKVLPFFAGFHLGILNTAEAWVAEDLGLDLQTQGAIITSAVIVGAVVGSLFAGQAADALGPKKALLLNNAWLLVGCVLCSGTPTGYWGLLAGKPLLLRKQPSWRPFQTRKRIFVMSGCGLPYLEGI